MRPPGRPVVFDDAKQQIFLRLIAAGFTARLAARHVGVSLSTVRHRARQSPAFDAACRQAKDEAIPSLLETIRNAGPRSWRASAWLLERMRPAQFGRRVALGPDPSVPLPKKLADFSTDQTIKHFMNTIRFSRESQALARDYLKQVEAEHAAWDAASKTYDHEYAQRGGRPNVFDAPQGYEYYEDPAARRADQPNTSKTSELPVAAPLDPPAASQSSNVNNSADCPEPPHAQTQSVQQETTTGDLAEPPNNCAFNP
jgi:hypothetical protein